MKKIGALVLAVVMVMAMGTTAFAAIGDGGTDTTGGNDLTFTKSILMKNKNASSVREPNIQYTYTITDAGISTDTSDGDPAYTVTDSSGNTAYVYSVVSEGVALTTVLPTSAVTVTFADTNSVSTSEAGVETSKNVTFTFAGSAFPHPGIYRFLVTETTNVTKESVGIIENTGYSNTMYLDVYVKGADGGNAIYGYVLFETNQNTNITSANALSEHNKSNGWCNGDAAGANYQNQDIYETYDVEVTKTVNSDTTGKNNQFPFVVTLGTNVANKIDVAVTNGSLTTAATPTLSTTDSTVINATMKDGGSLTITGIPAYAATTVDAVETNNTYDVYTATPTVNGTAETATVLQRNDTKAISQLSVAAKNLEKQTVAYANVMTQISPTGVVLRIAPYAIMLGAGVALFIVLVAKRRKQNDDEA